MWWLIINTFVWYNNFIIFLSKTKKKHNNNNLNTTSKFMHHNIVLHINYKWALDRGKSKGKIRETTFIINNIQYQLLPMLYKYILHP